MPKQIWRVPCCRFSAFLTSPAWLASTKVTMQLNPSYLSEDVKSRLKAALHDRSCLNSDPDISFDPHPFPHCTLRNFVADENFLDGLQAELNGLAYRRKNNDLYKFRQSGPLQKCSKPSVQEFRKFLYEDFLQWMKDVTGIQLTDVVDITAARYVSTDVLLCHDDELDGRRIAFIYYLVPPDWEQKDGGCLNLFDTDELGLPKDVAKSIVPVRNALLFFEVTPVSFHEVAEILCKGKCRLSLSGWFHGPTVERPVPHVESPLPRQPCVPVDGSAVDEEMLYSWINSTYVTSQVQADVRRRFEDNSEIQLDDFLQKEKYEALSDAIKSSDIKWIPRGPPIKRRYEVAAIDSLPDVVRQFVELFKSEAMFLILAGLTGLTGLHRMAEGDSHDEEEVRGDGDDRAGACPSSPKKARASSPAASTDDAAGPSRGRMPAEEATVAAAGAASAPSVSVEVRRWSHGAYTLIHDEDSDQGVQSALDVLMHFNCSKWHEDQGGYKSYVAKGEDEELLAVFPEENVLALVYRDKETLGFVKHVNHKLAALDQGSLYDVSLVYYE